MKNYKILLTLIFMLLSVLIFSWGNTIHREATLNACRLLEQYLGENFSKYTGIISDQGSLPDYWKAYDQFESPNHYLDLESFDEDKVPLDSPFNEVKKTYGGEFLRKNGTVVWAVEEYYKLLVHSFESGDFNRALTYMAACAHYIEDMHQPLHATKNYDGQLTGNKGIHSRYESNMITQEWTPTEITDTDTIPEPPAPDQIRTWAIEIINESNAYVQDILDADDELKPQKGIRVFGKEYYEILWEKTEDLTKNRIFNAERRTAAFFLSAWKAAGSPDFPENAVMEMQIDKPQFFVSGRRSIGDVSQKQIIFSGVLAAVLFIGIIAALKDL